MVDMSDLKSDAEKRAGSSPAGRTKFEKTKMHFATFAQYLNNYRLCMCLSWVEWERKVGISRTTLRRLEEGQMPTVLQVYRIAQATNQDSGRLFKKCVADIEWHDN